MRWSRGRELILLAGLLFSLGPLVADNVQQTYRLNLDKKKLYASGKTKYNKNIVIFSESLNAIF